MRTNPRVTPPFFRRLVAAGLAALVLAIALLAAAPAAHKHLHDDADHADHECAIVFLAHGVTLTTALAAAKAVTVEWRETFPAAPVALHLTSPRHLLPLQCGPPSLA
jgi:hypothetical protein